MEPPTQTALVLSLGALARMPPQLQRRHDSHIQSCASAAPKRRKQRCRHEPRIGYNEPQLEPKKNITKVS